MPKLILTEPGKTEEKVFPIGGETTIGRFAESTVPLKGDGISREHAKIIKENDQFHLLDLGSGNGTLLNGLVVKPNEKNLLRNNDRIQIENYHLKFWQTDEIFEARLKEEEEVTDADILEVKLLKKILNAVDQETLPSFEVLNGSQEGKRFFLTDDMEEIVMGREPSCDFPINEVVISRQHARIMKKWGGIALIDCGSKNGSFINNKRVTEEFLHDGDRIALGTIVLLFRNPQEINLKAMSEEIARKHPPLPSRAYVKPEAQKEGEDTGNQDAEEILKGLPTLKPAPANVYPAPHADKNELTALEIGMIGLGVIVLAMALITLVNLVLE